MSVCRLIYAAYQMNGGVMNNWLGQLWQVSVVMKLAKQANGLQIDHLW